MSTPTTATAEPAPVKSSKRRRALAILALVVIVAGVAWLLYHFLVGRWHEETDDAYAQGNIVTITPQTVGTVTGITADDGMRVEAGQVLVQLDATDAQVAYDQAIANLANTVRTVRGLYSSVSSSEAEIRAREVAIAKLRADVARRSGLVATGAVSAEELAHARDDLASAEAALATSRGNLSRNRALVDATTVQNQPQVQAAAAQVRSAYLALQRGAIVAPVTGYVAKRSVQLGQRVQPGQTLMTVIPLEQVWVEANFKETQLAKMRIGQPVELHSDLYGKDVTFNGRLSSLGLGTGSAFSLLPAQNASGNWIKIVQRVPVRIEVPRDQLVKHPLRIGLSMSADVDMHDQSGAVLASAPPQKPLFTTSAYERQMQTAQDRIDQVIRENLSGRNG
ncbi:HlyD family efflux transporter periplasmic adaptor subunit [Lysobacter sp. TY2-98]|uniref:efflux RND transporter periplasmic adaptor subunit n=1 Tax=Lysobacter sp. TY2-98 TaxID=2290922 RepID=UPI000E208BAC|nr:efflux RND transporter periplasmic adaptor subunit [Lysobacter sp. TY2-98]AXK71988.1 HlyD family efflux transporter periplasmic adaptor subunit [Lysobacter sp. TY2-98]